MILALLLAAVSPQDAVEAERAFAAMAQTEGPGAAFRAYAAPDGIMFAPDVVNAQAQMAGVNAPPGGLMWWPARSWVSCDGALAVNTGPWLRRGGQTGTFTTVWQRQADGGWKWLLDHGRPTPRPVPAGEAPKVGRASCSGATEPAAIPPTRRGAPAQAGDYVQAPAADLLVQEEGRMPASRPSARLAFAVGEPIRSGASPDGTLAWRVDRIADAPPGARLFTLYGWDGRRYRLFLMEISGLAPRD